MPSFFSPQYNWDTLRYKLAHAQFFWTAMLFMVSVRGFNEGTFWLPSLFLICAVLETLDFVLTLRATQKP